LKRENGPYLPPTTVSRRAWGKILPEELNQGTKFKKKVRRKTRVCFFLNPKKMPSPFRPRGGKMLGREKKMPVRRSGIPPGGKFSALKKKGGKEKKREFQKERGTASRGQ